MENLSLPISDDAVCGEYLKANKTLYRALRNNFNQAQSSYRQLMESPDAMSDKELLEGNANNWRALGESCRECLQNNSKDVEVFCWFISAQLFTPDPLNNLRDALKVFVQVIDAQWVDLQPKPPVEKLKSNETSEHEREWAEFKVKPLWQLAGESESSGLLAMPLSNLPLIGTINYTQFFSAERSGSLQLLKEESKQYFAGNSNLLQEKIVALDAILKEVAKLEKSVNQHCLKVQAKSISFKFILKVINNLLGAMQYLLGDSFATWPLNVIEQQQSAAPDSVDAQLADTKQNEPAAVESKNNSVSQVQLSVNTELYHRDQAFEQLRTIADFFRRTEPHSPIYMLLERSIRWGYMSLPQLLDEMVGDNEPVMQRISQMAGLETVDKTIIPRATMNSAELERHQSHASVLQQDTATNEKLNSSPVATEGREKANGSNAAKPEADDFTW